jgi:hypothetical protein
MERAELQMPAGRPDEAVAEVFGRTRGGQLELVGVLAAEERVGPFQRVGVVDQIARPDVLEEEHGRELPVVDALGRLPLLLDDADVAGVERADALSVADDHGVMQDERFIGRIEVDGQLRGVLYARARQHLADAAVVLDDACAFDADLVVVEQPPDPIADVVRGLLVADVDAVDPHRLGTDEDVLRGAHG